MPGLQVILSVLLGLAQPAKAATTLFNVSGSTVGVIGAVTDNTTPPNGIEWTGGKAVTNGAAPGTITSGNVGGFITDTERRLVVQTYHPNMFSCNVNGKTARALCQAKPASKQLYITDYVVGNAGTAQSVSIQLSSTSNCTSGGVFTVLKGSYTLAANGQLAVNLNTPVSVGAANSICCANSGTTAFNCDIGGFTAP